MTESPLLKNARRKMAEHRQFELDRLAANSVSQRKGVIRNVIRGVLLLLVLVAFALYFAR